MEKLPRRVSGGIFGLVVKRHVIIYDGECRLCLRSAAWLRRLDWLSRFDCLPASDPAVAAIAPSLKSEALQAAVHCVTLDGRICRAAAAFRFIGLRMPLFFPFALLLHLPGTLMIAERIYRGVSLRRHRFGYGPRCVCR